MKQNQQYTELNCIPPSSTELEKAVLGALLLEKEAYSKIEGILSDTDFYSPKHSIIFRHIKNMSDKNDPVDMLTVVQSLYNSGKLDEAGNVSYISGLTSNIASAVHIEHHATIIKQKAVEREIINISQQAIKKVHEGEIIGDVMFWQGKEIEKQQEALTGKQSTNHISEAVKKALNDMSIRMEHAKSGRPTGISTGLKGLDSITGGWQNSDLIIIAARPAMGKTAFALHFAKTAAKNDCPAALFSLEMSDISLANRLLLSESNINSFKFRSGKLTCEESIEIEKAAGTLCKLPIYIDDNASVSMSYIRSKARLLNKQGKCKIVIIDYLQLATDTNNKNRNREQEIAQMSREAKVIAKELNIPVLLLSQLSRKVEERTDKRPLLSDLRESGAIEQDADMVCFIHRPEYYEKELHAPDNSIVKNGIEFIISKYRNGATGSLIVQHDGTLNKIFDYGTNGNMPF